LARVFENLFEMATSQRIAALERHLHTTSLTNNVGNNPELNETGATSSAVRYVSHLEHACKIPVHLAFKPFRKIVPLPLFYLKNILVCTERKSSRFISFSISNEL
jgi:hypothetical protein